MPHCNAWRQRKLSLPGPAHAWVNKRWGQRRFLVLSPCAQRAVAGSRRQSPLELTQSLRSLFCSVVHVRMWTRVREGQRARAVTIRLDASQWSGSAGCVTGMSRLLGGTCVIGDALFAWNGGSARSELRDLRESNWAGTSHRCTPLFALYSNYTHAYKSLPDRRLPPFPPAHPRRTPPSATVYSLPSTAS